MQTTNETALNVAIPPQAPLQSPLTVAEYLGRWLETAMRGNIQPTTYGIYRGHISKHIAPRIGGIPLADLRKERLQRFAAELVRGGDLANGSIRAIFKMLKAALNEAVEWGYIDKNHAHGVRLPKEEHGHVNAFTREEQDKIEAAIAVSDDGRDFGILICLYTGLRLGELCGLKWEQVDFEHKQIRIVGCIKRVPNLDGADAGNVKTVVRTTKPKTSSSRRVVFLPDFLCEKLLKRKSDSASEYVIAMQDGRYVEPRTMQFVHKRLLDRAGVPYRKLHSTRHAYATRSLEVGVDIKTISENMGHSSCAILLTYYAHSHEQQKREAADRMNSLYNNKTRLDF